MNTIRLIGIIAFVFVFVLMSTGNVAATSYYMPWYYQHYPYYPYYGYYPYYPPYYGGYGGYWYKPWGYYWYW